MRYYDPTTGRFERLDPAKDGVNWYGYVDGNPLGAVDPWGLGLFSWMGDRYRGFVKWISGSPGDTCDRVLMWWPNKFSAFMQWTNTEAGQDFLAGFATGGIIGEEAGAFCGWGRAWWSGRAAPWFGRTGRWIGESGSGAWGRVTGWFGGEAEEAVCASGCGSESALFSDVGDIGRKGGAGFFDGFGEVPVKTLTKISGKDAARIDAELIKQEMGCSPVSRFNLYYDKATRRIYINKNGSPWATPTDYNY